MMMMIMIKNFVIFVRTTSLLGSGSKKMTAGRWFDQSNCRHYKSSYKKSCAHIYVLVYSAPRIHTNEFTVLANTTLDGVTKERNTCIYFATPTCHLFSDSSHANTTSDCVPHVQLPPVEESAPLTSILLELHCTYHHPPRYTHQRAAKTVAALPPTQTIGACPR